MEPLQPDVYQGGSWASALSAEELVEARREKLQHLALWPKLNSANLYQVTVSDVQELFAIFDVEGSGEISMEELMEIKKVQGLGLTKDDIAALGRDADKDGSGLISVNELYKAFIQGEVAYNLIKKSINEENKVQHLAEGECLIDDLIDWMRQEYETNADLWSLPQTLLLFCVFLYTASSHLPMRAGWEIAENYPAASLFGYYRLAWLYDRLSLMDFLVTTWIDQHLNQDQNLYTPGRYFGRNQVIGGFRFRRFYTTPQKCSMPTYLERVYYPFPRLGVPQVGNEPPGVPCYKFGAEAFEDRWILYHERKESVRRTIDEWTYTNWLDDNTTALNIDSVLLNPYLGTYTFESLTFRFEINGFMKHVQFAETFVAEPYKDWTNTIPDVLFILILFRILYSEMRELLPALSIGFDGIMNYLQFWNVVDWLAIIWGAICAGLWVVFCIFLSMVEPRLEALPLRRMDSLVFANQTYMEAWEVNIVMPRQEIEGRLQSMMQSFQDASLWHEATRMLCVLYLFVLMLKFFKSFKANAQLDVVITTLSGSVKDVSHFAIVFLTIFLCYAWSAHIFFGKDIEGCSTILGAIFWRWSSGVGVFNMEDLDLLGRILGYTYTLSYEFLVQNLLFGILFGLIFEAYGRTQKAAGNPITVVEQIRLAVKEMRKKKDFLDFWYTINRLIDDDLPAHPAEVVTVKSLCEAFQADNMTKVNAEYIISHVREYQLSKNSEVEVSLLHALRLVSQTRTSSLRSIQVTESILGMLKAESQKPQELRFRCIMAGFDPDAPGEMQEFMRITAMQALEDDNPLPGQVQQPAQSAGVVQHNSESKATVNSHSVDGTKEEPVEVVDRSEQQAKELQLKAGLDRLAEIAHESQVEDALTVSETLKEIEAHQEQSASFKQEQQARRKDLSSQCLRAQEGASQLADRFQSTDLHTLQDLPERIGKLAQLAKASRKAVESAKPGFGSDPLKRLEMSITLLSVPWLSPRGLKAQNDLKAMLNNLISILALGLENWRFLRCFSFFSLCSCSWDLCWGLQCALSKLEPKHQSPA
ncbi:PKD2 [Symbiodinium pilosum]|uniref:PKD2 protein n=1 Tax=Symbiodinium pilosum TaxID=2952 RepID=A0A812V2H3_SYMPI|nr:PKD2 [Symbiodinium pilosum]